MTVLFISLYLVTILVTVAVFSTLKYRFLKITIFNVFMYFAIVFNFVGIPILFFRLDAYRAEFVIDDMIILKLFLFIILTFTALVVGYLIGLASLKNEMIFKANIGRQVYQSSTGGFFIGLFFFALGIVGLMRYLDLVGFANLPVVIAITGNPIDVAIARSRASAEVTALRWFQLFMHDFLLIGGLLLVFWLDQVKKLKFAGWGLKLLLIGFIGFVFILGGEKAQIINVLFAFYLLYRFYTDGHVAVRSLIIPALIGLACLMAMYWFLMGSNSIPAVLRGVFSRTLTGQLQGGYHHIEYTDLFNLWLGGTSFPNPRGIFPFESFILSEELMKWVHMGGINSQFGIVGSMPTFFWGELYANFNIVGVVAGAFLVGVLLALLDTFFYPHNGSPIAVCFYIWLALHFKDLAFTGTSQFIIDIKLWPVLFIILAATFVRQFLRRTTMRVQEQNNTQMPSSS